MMISPILIAGAVIAAAPGDPPREQQPRDAAVQEAPPKKKNAEARIDDLEREVERLKLQTPEESPGAQPTPPAAGVSANVFNPTLTVVGNGLYRYDDKAVVVDDSRVDKTFNLREV